METQRFASIVPVGFRREVNETFEYGGFTFPKGCIVWPVLDSVLLDKKIWGDPETFRPERFINEDGALLNREEFVPFGVGKRLCLGEALAKMELFLFLSALFQRFKVEPETPEKLPTLETSFSNVLVPQPFKVKFTERKI
jgi:cytochrome P450